MQKLKFILSGGGTGGHIYPAIAIADELKKRFPDCDILFVGAKDKMEMQKVPQAGYSIKGLWISGIQRRLTLGNSLFPFKLLDSLLKSRTIIKNFKPDAAIGTGGFASGPLLRVAGLAGIPTIIQEQNSFPGITNKWLGKTADKICVAYENLERFFPKGKIIMTGNPVRQDLLDIQARKSEAAEYFKLDPSKKTLLVLGGSLGSRRINQLAAKELVNFASQGIQLIWQCGKIYIDEYRHFNSKEDVQVMAFIDRMDLAYAAADIIISRAGASSVSELCLVGKPVIFIPSPNVAEDHQTKNAQAVADRKGALMVKENELDTQFASTFNMLLGDQHLQDSLSVNIKKMAMPGATGDIVDEIIKIVESKKSQGKGLMA
ncbi:MAG TPA: undecaprenyldiphospho-muramoylpentapeptide beta-N-acetylglucosaminyltransferase [Flavobacterium sp.]|nr:undecaprenyldiphospho-muramoylpentapeptide beta-N-acetylglucosaminyltransferase [Flavobacterium sp.]